MRPATRSAARSRRHNSRRAGAARCGREHPVLAHLAGGAPGYGLVVTDILGVAALVLPDDLRRLPE